MNRGQLIGFREFTVQGFGLNKAQSNFCGLPSCLCLLWIRMHFPGDGKLYVLYLCIVRGRAAYIDVTSSRIQIHKAWHKAKVLVPAGLIQVNI